MRALSTTCKVCLQEGAKNFLFTQETQAWEYMVPLERRNVSEGTYSSSLDKGHQGLQWGLQAGWRTLGFPVPFE